MNEEAAEKFRADLSLATTYTYPENFEIVCNHCGSRDTGLGLRDDYESPGNSIIVIFCYECRNIEEVY